MRYINPRFTYLLAESNGVITYQNFRWKSLDLLASCERSQVCDIGEKVRR